MRLHTYMKNIFNIGYLDWLLKDYATIYTRLLMKQYDYRFKHNISLYYQMYPDQKESSTVKNYCTSVETKSGCPFLSC